MSKGVKSYLDMELHYLPMGIRIVFILFLLCLLSQSTGAQHDGSEFSEKIHKGDVYRWSFQTLDLGGIVNQSMSGEIQIEVLEKLETVEFGSGDFANYFHFSSTVKSSQEAFVPIQPSGGQQSAVYQATVWRLLSSYITPIYTSDDQNYFEAAVEEYQDSYEQNEYIQKTINITGDTYFEYIESHRPVGDASQISDVRYEVDTGLLIQDVDTTYINGEIMMGLAIHLLESTEDVKSTADPLPIDQGMVLTSLILIMLPLRKIRKPDISE
jgi:hypothetical protein